MACRSITARLTVRPRPGGRRGALSTGGGVGGGGGGVKERRAGAGIAAGGRQTGPEGLRAVAAVLDRPLRGQGPPRGQVAAGAVARAGGSRHARRLRLAVLGGGGRPPA